MRKFGEALVTVQEFFGQGVADGVTCDQLAMTSPHLTSRSYADERDIERMRDLLFRAKQAQLDKLHWHSSDFGWGYFLATISGDSTQLYRLWERAGEVVAFALFDPHDKSFDLPMHPSVTSDALRDEMFAWVMGRFNMVRNVNDELLTGGSDDDVQGHIAFLQRKGFKRGEHCYIHNARSLVEPIDAPTMPVGFVMRAVAGEQEHGLRAAAHRSAFQPSRVTAKQYQRFMRLASYDRETDIVAVARNGTIAAFAKIWIDDVNKVGEFEPVGTHADYRRLGLAKAVLLEGLRRMQVWDMQTAMVISGGGDGSDASAGARKLYESVGFKAARRDYDWTWKG